MDLSQRLGAILRALDITEIRYTLNGEGDSGEAELERVQYRGRSDSTELPDIPIFITDMGGVQSLPHLLYGIVVEAPEGDWVNNEGGYGTVTIHPFEDDECLSIECDMTYRDEEDYDDEDDFVDDELTDAEEAPIEGSIPLIVVGEVAS